MAVPVKKIILILFGAVIIGTALSLILDTDETTFVDAPVTLTAYSQDYTEPNMKIIRNHLDDIIHDRPIEYYGLQKTFSVTSLESYAIITGDEKPMIVFEIGEITDNDYEKLNSDLGIVFEHYDYRLIRK